MKNTSWVALMDTDEFLRINNFRPGYQDEDDTSEWPVLSYLQERDPDINCLHVPRLQMSSQKDKSSSYAVPSDLTLVNGTSFLTLDWLYHSGQEIHMGHDLDGKNVLNLRFLEDEIPRKIPNVHKVLDACPSTSGDRLKFAESWLSIHHYLGTYEQYMFRQDPRDQIPGRPTREEMWKKAGNSDNNSANNVRDDSIGSWLADFVKSVGANEASKLLSDVGRVTET